MNKYSSDVMLLMVDYLQKALEEQTLKIKTIEEQLVATTPAEKWKKIKEKTQKLLIEYRKKYSILHGKNNHFIELMEAIEVVIFCMNLRGLVVIALLLPTGLIF